MLMPTTTILSSAWAETWLPAASVIALLRLTVTEAYYDAALAEDMGIVPFYGLANGFLTGKYRSKEDLDKSVRGLRNVEYLEGRGMRVLAALDEIAAETGAPLAAIALAWTNAQPGITATLASATRLAQLQELIGSMHLKLTDDQIARLDEASAEAVPA